MAALIQVQERLGEHGHRDPGHRDHDHGDDARARAGEVISGLIDRLGHERPKPPGKPPGHHPPGNPPPVTPPPVTPPPVTPPPVTPPPVEPPPVVAPPVEPAPAPVPAPAPPVLNSPPVQRLQAVLAQLHEAPAPRFSSLPFSQRETTRAATRPGVNRWTAARSVYTAVRAQTALALFQAPQMNPYAFRAAAAYAPFRAGSYFGMSRLV